MRSTSDLRSNGQGGTRKEIKDPENCGEGIAKEKLRECELGKSLIRNPQNCGKGIVEEKLRKFEYENW